MNSDLPPRPVASKRTYWQGVLGQPAKLVYFRQMASITLSLPDDLASEIRANRQQLPRILELGLRELNAARQSEFYGAEMFWNC